jgi:peptidoglycan hydrolase-like protein with peptidoglycan-binding domain
MGDRILREGMSGHDVRVLQHYLTLAGFPTPVSGHFGPLTKHNLIAFQRSRGLTPNGVLTFSVSQTLRGAIVTTSIAAPVSNGEVIDGLALAPADAPAVVKEVIAAGNRIAFARYIWDGGHLSWSSPGYDCSGSVSYALRGGSLLSSPEVSAGFESYGSAGAGRWITIWANSGHVYMYAAGLRFDTSAQSSTGGSRWTTQARSNNGFMERHPTTQ